MTDNDTLLRIRKFKYDLTRRTSLDIARRHIFFGDCAVISSDEYFKLRTAVATEFGLHPNDVLVVGSAKLGFSIAPHKRYRAFGDSSDLDVVIVSKGLFDTVWQDLHRYSTQGGYWEKSADFKQYLFRGWIRPDKLPPDQNFDFARIWWTFFNRLSVSRQYSAARVTGAIYQSWYFLESYQTGAVDGCAEHLPDHERITNEN